MIYAKAHDQTVADDYFAAMQRVEERLEIVPKAEENMENVKVQTQVFQLIGRLESPELCTEERLSLASQLREAWSVVHEHPPPSIIS